MDFPSYVPNAVRVSMAARLEGDSHERIGWISVLANVEDLLQSIQRQQAEWHHDEAMSNKLRIDYAQTKNHRDYLAADVRCCQRLVYDARMQSVYALLVSLPNVTDAHLSGFIAAAWTAHIDYAKRRDRVKAADELAREVAKAAGALAELLNKAEDFRGPNLPSEFFSIQSLLEKTAHDDSDRNFHMWLRMRRVIFGDPKRSEPTDPSAIEIRFVMPHETERVGPAETARNAVRYAWGTVPSMARIVATMQQEALNFAATESGYIAAALATQKRNPKYEYLRAFGALLRDEHRLELTTATMRAMATTATVVLNEPDLDVTHDDVRKALATIAS